MAIKVRILVNLIIHVHEVQAETDASITFNLKKKTPVTPALQRQKQEDLESKASHGYSECEASTGYIKNHSRV